MNSTQKAIDAVLELFRKLPDATFHPSLFTMTGHRAGMPHAIRKLKVAGFIEIAGRNYNDQPLYRKTDQLVPDITWQMVY